MSNGRGAVWALVSALAGGWFAAASAQTGSLCAVVKLEIRQEATLEREAFDARLVVSNNLPDTALTSLRVQLFVTDSAGKPADEGFFVKVTSVAGTNGVDGTGVVQSSSSAEIHWLIIPSSGSGGANPAGRRYGVSALITGESAGTPQSVKTFEDFITVHPQPVLRLEYALPFEVFGDEPLTAAVEPIEPFPLAVRVSNVGFGAATDFKIDSAQPKIVENKQGLQIEFKLLGTVVSGKTIPNTLLIPFGDVEPGGVRTGSWIMTTSLSGRFIEFSSTFTHAASLGGDLTSLLQEIKTHTLLKDVLVDLPSRDQNPDFLVNVTQNRETMIGFLDTGAQPAAEFILESDQPQPLPVTEVESTVTGALGGTNASLTLAFVSAVSSNVWVHTSVPFAFGDQVTVIGARRADGKDLSPKNVWLSKHFRKSDKAVLYRLNLLDFTSEARTYAIQFNATALEQPPGAVADFSAETGFEGGTLRLAWTAPGDDGQTGDILGGSYFIQAEESAAAAFDPANAQIRRTTSTSPGSREVLPASDLLGNTTLHLRLWTQDTGGRFSSISNSTSAYTLPNPPADLVFASVSTDSIGVSWRPGNNRLPVEYRVVVDTDAAAPVLAASPFQDSFNRSSTFTALAPNTLFHFRGQARNPETFASSQFEPLASTATLAAAPAARPQAGASTTAVTVSWETGGNPAGTEFFVELSSVASREPVLAVSGWLAATSFTFAGLSQDTTYYARVKARNLDLVETGFTDLGAAATRAGDVLPPRTSLASGERSFGADPVFVSSLTPIGFAAVDDLAVPGDGLGDGVARTLFSLDGGSFTVFAASFTLAEERRYAARYFSEDLSGNVEAVRLSTVAVDATPPATRLDSSTEPFFLEGRAYISETTSLGFTAEDPSTDTASGVSRTEFRVDASSEAVFAVFASTFALAEGIRVIEFRSRDRVDNVEATQSVTGHVDATPPVTTLAISTPSYAGAAGAVFVSSSTPLALAAKDPESAGAASGVRETLLAVDGGSYAVGSATFSLTGHDGLRTLAYLSVDNVANAEVARSSQVFLDATAPITMLLKNGFAVEAATVTAVSTDVFTLGAVDLGSGVRETRSAIDGAAERAYAGAFGLAAGTHTLVFRSRDNVDNVEAPRIVSVNVAAADRTPPDLALRPLHGSTVATPTPELAALYSDAGAGIDAASVRLFLDGVDVTSQAVVTLSEASFAPPAALTQGTHTVAALVADRAANISSAAAVFLIDSIAPETALLVNGAPAAGNPILAVTTDAFSFSAFDAGTGVLETLFSIDAASETVFAAAFTLAAGTYTVSFRSRDRAGNLEASKFVALDIRRPASPVVTLFPPDRSTVTTPTPLIAMTYVDEDLGVDTTTVRLRLDGLDVTAQSFITASSASFAPAALSQGTHTVEGSVSNRAGAETGARSNFFVDSLAPVTALLINGNAVTASSTVAVSTDSFSFSAFDAGTGVLTTLFSLDGGAEVVFSTPFALGPGGHTVAFQSRDRAGNTEDLKSAFVRVRGLDSEPPVMTLTPVDASTITTARPAVVATYADAGSGVDLSTFKLTADGNDITAFVSVFPSSAVITPPEDIEQGRHALRAGISDLAGNRTEIESVFYIDSIAPATTLEIGPPRFGAEPVFIASYTLLGFSVSEPARTSYAVDFGSFTLFSASFTVPSEGSRMIHYFSADLAGNAEVIRTSHVFVDSLAPETALLVNGAAVATATLVAVTTDLFSFSATDAGSGVLMTLFSLDGGAEQVYSSPFTLGPGGHTVAFHSRDNLGNLEPVRTSSVSIRAPDTTAPSLSLVPSHGSTVAAAIPLIAAVYSDFDSGVDTATLRLELDGTDITAGAFVTASSASFTPGAALSQGTHSVTASVADRTGNVSSAAAVFLLDSLAADSDPPVMTLTPVDGSTVTTARPTVVVTYADAGSGVDLSTFRLVADGNDITAFVGVFPSSAVITPPEDIEQGVHVVTAAISDLAGNRTEIRSVFYVDSVPPATALEIGPPRFGAEPVFIASYTLLGFSVSEPARTSYAVDVGSFTLFTASFTIPSEGLRLIHYFSADLAGNAEVIRTSDVFVDATPPVTTLLKSGRAVVDAVLSASTTDLFSFSATDSGSGVLMTLFSLDAGAEQVYSSPFTLGPGGHTVAFHSRDNLGNLEPVRTSSVSIRAPDTTAPSLSLVPSHGSTVAAAIPLIAAVYSDFDSGVDTATLRFVLDGADITAGAFVTASSASFTPAAALSQGTHSVTARVADRAGNVASAASTFLVDSLAPVTTLLVNEMGAGPGPLAAAATDYFSFAAVDLGSGVLETLYSIDAGPQLVFLAPFNLSPGAHTLAFQSRDRAGNLEASRAVAVSIASPPAFETPPGLIGTFTGSLFDPRGVAFDGPGIDEGRGLALDAAGNIYVTGISSQGAAGMDWIVFKYDPSGRLLAASHIDRSGSDMANDVAVHGSSVYVVGRAFDQGTILYDLNLASRAASPFGGEAVALDGSGNVYTLEQSSVGPRVVKLSPGLDLVAESPFTGTLSGRPPGDFGGRSGALAYYPVSDRVYAVGTGSSGFDVNVLISEYTTALEPVRSVEFGAPGAAFKGHGIAAHPGTGDLYAVATAGSGNSPRTAVLRFGPDLAFISSTTLPSSHADVDISVDPLGDVYVAGHMGLFRLSPTLDIIACSQDFTDTHHIAVKDAANVYASGDTGFFTSIRLVKRDLSTPGCRPSGDGGGGAPEGLAIAIEPSGGIWEAWTENDEILLGKFDSQGAPLGDLTLPGAADFGAWSLQFEPVSGDVFAVGASGGEPDVDVAIYRVSPGLDLVSSAAFNSSFNKADFAFGSSGDLWITGGIQTGGSFEAGDAQVVLGLWKFDPGRNLIALTTTYAGGGGLDAGLGVDVDASGSVWVLGYSSNPATSGPNRLDLALWKFAPDGRSLTSGPFLRSGYLREPDESFNAELVIAGSAIFAAAPRLNALGNTDLAFLKYGLDGGLVSESFWHSTAGEHELVHGMAAGPGGRLLVAGAVQPGPDENGIAGVWSYDPAGALVFAEAVAGESQARDAAARGADVWLAVKSSSPYRFTGGAALPGAEGVETPPAPPVSAVVFPPDGGTITSLLAISGTARGDAGVAEVGVSVLRLSDGRYWTGSSYQTGEVFVLAAGTTAWSLLSGSGIHSGAGTFVITSRAKDSQGTFQEAFADGVSRVTVTRKLNSAADFRVTARSSSTLELAWDANGNPLGTLYRVHYATGTCQSQDFLGASSFSPATPAGQTIVGGLDSLTSYALHLHILDADGADQTTGAPGAPGSGSISAGTLGPGQGVDSSQPAFSSCEGGGVLGNAGLALSVDSGGRIWAVGAENSVIKFFRYGGPGASLETTLELPGASGQGDWSVAFDTAGGAYAVGTSFGLETGVDVAVYRTDASGTLLLSSRTFDSFFSKNDFALDSSGDVWISGAIQTGGPADFSGPVEISLALWRYCPHDDSLVLTSTYSAGSGFDGGFGVALDAAQDIWVVGFSSNPATPGPARLDLALWKFDAAGRTLLAGPYRRPGYLRELAGKFNAKVAISSAGIFAVATRYDPSGDLDLGFVKFAPDGRVLVERAWRGTGGQQDLAADLAVDPQGNVVVAGGVASPGADFDGTQDRLAVWTYAPDGGLVSARSGSAGSANDIGLRGAEAWLSVQDSPAPFLFTGGAALDGEDVLISSTAVDATPPDLSLTPVTGSTLTAARPSLAAAYADSGSGIDLPSLRLLLDGVAADAPIVGSSAAIFVPAGPITQGQHRWEAAIRDLAGNAGSAVSIFFVDSIAPATELVVIGTSVALSQGVGLHAGSSVALAAQDPVVDGFATGVATTFFLIDVSTESCASLGADPGAPAGTCANAVFTGPFTLSPGTHTVRFASRDAAGNTEDAGISALTADALPPRTSLSVGEPRFGAEPLYVSTRTPLGLTAVDDLAAVADALGVGVDRTRLAVDGGAFSAVSASFTLAAEGPRLVSFLSVDRVENAEAVRSSTVTVDATAPVTAFLVNGVARSTGILVVVSTDSLSLSASDLGSGVRETLLAVNDGPPAAFSSSFGLAPGTHTLTFQSRDNVDNLEALQTVAILVLAPDAEAPALSLAPVDGSTVTTFRPLIVAAYADSGSGVNLSSLRLQLDGNDVTAQSVVGASSAAFTPTADLAEGAHVLFASVADFAGNVSTTASRFFIDSVAPATELVIGAPKFGPDPPFISTSTPVGFTVSEPALTFFAVDLGTITAFVSPFNLAVEGLRDVSYFSRDLAGNEEVLRSSHVFVDATPPVTALFVNGVVKSSGILVVVSTDSLSLSASDLGSGVRETLLVVDGGPPTAFVSPFSLAPGTHTLTFQSRDNVDNSEALRTVAVRALAPDADAPSLSLAPVDGSTATTSRPLIVASYSDLGSGVNLASLRLELDDVEVSSQTQVNASSAVFTPAVGLSQGPHALFASVADFAGNVSTAASRFFIDSVAPQTQLVIGTPRFGAAPVTVATATPFGFTVSEPSQTSFAVDAGSFTLFTASFTLSSEGLRSLSFFSVDSAGNTEATRLETVGLDATAPVTGLTLAGPVFSGGGETFISSSTLIGFSAQDPVSQGVSAGVGRTEFRVDSATAPLSNFGSAFHLPEGPHFIAFRSVDNVENQEVLRSSAVTVDAAPPVTVLLVNGLANSTTDLAVISTDVLAFLSTDTASGVREVRFVLNGGGETVFTASFSLTPGIHALSFGGVDNVGNAEARRTVSVRVSAQDAESPSLSVTPVDGSTVTTARPLIVAAYADAGSGVNLSSLRLQLDGNDVTAQIVVGASSAVFTPPANLSQGSHALFASAADFAGNVSTAASRFFIDSVAPATELVIGTPKFGPDPTFISTSTPAGFTVSEPALTFFAVDSSSFSRFGASFTISGEGLRVVSFFSRDLAGNEEALRSGRVFVDASAPVTTLLVNGAEVVASPWTAVSTDVFTLVSTDAASDVRRSLIALDGGPEQSFGAAFSLTPGAHTVAFRSEDNVLNMEARREALIVVQGPDVVAPGLSLSPPHGSTVTTAAPAIVAAYSDSGSGIDPASVRLELDGLDVTAQAVVGSTFAVFIPGAALSQGTHTASAAVADRAGNRSEARSTFLVDSAAPETTLLVNGAAVVTATLVAVTTDLFSFSATDAGSGVLETLFSVDGGAEQVFSGAFSLTAGAHTVSFRSRDRAGNLETARTVTVNVAAGGFVVSLDLKPETFNLRSQGEFVMAVIEVAGGESAANIATNTVRVSEVDGRAVSPPVFIDPKGPVTLSDSDGDGFLELKVKFPRDELAAVLPGDKEVRITVAGVFRGGATFTAQDDIRTIGRPVRSAAASVEADLSLVAVYAFPNPARRENPVIRVQVGLADSVELKITTMLGTPVHSASLGSARLVDTGGGAGPQWTYDYVWDVGGVRTGVYTFQITARKAGYPDVRAMGRVAVIK